MWTMRTRTLPIGFHDQTGGPRTLPSRNPHRIPCVIDPQETTALARRAQGGDGAAFGELYKRSWGLLYSFVASQVGNRDEIVEIVQEAFTRAFEGIGSLREPAAFPGFLRTIASRVVFHRRGRTDPAAAEPDEAADDTAPGPAESAERSEFERALHRALEGFPPHHREAILLRLVEGLKYREIGERLGMGLDQAKGIIARGVLRLTDSLRPFLEEHR